jgi:hypothetical protein
VDSGALIDPLLIHSFEFLRMAVQPGHGQIQLFPYSLSMLLINGEQGVRLHQLLSHGTKSFIFGGHAIDLAP